MPGTTQTPSNSRPISSWKPNPGSPRVLRMQGGVRVRPTSRELPSGAETPLVIVVDDDEAVRLALVELMESVGLDAVSFGSTSELLEADLTDRPGCLVLDVRMPGLSGLDLQTQLSSSGDGKPVVFVSGHGDIPMTVQAMKAGAIDFLTKPVRGQALLDGMKGQTFESPRGNVYIDAQTRDIVQNVYIRRVERVNGQLYNMEFDVLKDVKDPAKTGK